ncbi:MAG TPA: hypothetical protein VGH40_22350 [Roseiarcus sp.]
MFCAVRAVEGDAVLVATHLGADFGLSRLDPVPQRGVDDAERFVGCLLPLILRVHAGHALARRRMTDVRTAVPNNLASVGGIVKHPGSAIHLAPDGRVDPGATVRAGNPFGVKAAGNRPRRGAVGVVRKNTPDDFGLRGNDQPIAGRVRFDLVAIGERPRRLSSDDFAAQPALGLVLEIVEKALRHRAENADH